jgi:glycosyltransferase involved in cell wall biosynthesis
MKILMLGPSYHPLIGGAETYAYVLGTQLAARGHRIRVATDLPHGMPADQAVGHQPPGVEVTRLWEYRASIFDESRLPWEQLAFGLAPELARIVDDFEPDLILSNSLDTAFSAATIGLHYRRPWVSVFHEQAPEREPLGRGRLQLVYERLRPDLVIAGSEFYAARARQWGAADRVVMIHHGVETDHDLDPADVAQVRRRYRVSADETLVVCVGRLKARKGMVELVQAVRRVRQAGLPARLVIAGTVNSASRQYADRLAGTIDDLGLAGVVDIDQSVSITEVPYLLAAADIVAQPSYEEGLGLAILEAMAIGTPVVATDIDGVREIVADTDAVAVVAAGDVSALARELSMLMKDEQLRADRGAAGRVHVLRRFSVERMISDTEKALLLIASANRDTEG